jgi:hypothetical protein
LGSIRLKCWENLTAGLTGWLYLRGSCAPADCAWPDWEGAESSTPSPNLVPLNAQYAPLSDARPWSPTQPATHPFHYRTLRIPPVPQRASQGLVRGDDASRPQRTLRTVLIPLMPCTLKPSLARVWTCFIPLCAPSGEGLISASNEFEA